MVSNDSPAVDGRRWLRLLLVAWLLLPMGWLVSCGKPKPADQPQAEAGGFVYWMNAGKNRYEQGKVAEAMTAFQKAIALQPTNPDAQLNLANALLLANQNEEALQAAKSALDLEAQSAAARYVAGCAALRLAKFADAIKYLQECRDLDLKVNAVSFQLARAHQNAGHFEEAAELLRSVLQWEPKHPAAHYLLSQALVRLGQTQAAQEAAQLHEAIRTEKAGPAANPERCIYTEARAPFVLEQPAAQGVRVKLADVTTAAFGNLTQNYHAPVGVIDIDQRGHNDLFVSEGDTGFRLLLNTNGTFHPAGSQVPGLPGAQYRRCLVGDLNNDRFDDVVVFSDKGLQVFKLATNGVIADATAFAGMKRQTGLDGALVDIDLTGKLDLILLSPTNRELRLLRNLGPMYFKDITATSGIPATLTEVRQIVVDDWNGDDLMDVIVARAGQPPLILLKQRGGLLVPTNPPSSWPAGNLIAAGDLNNDFRTDLVIAAADKLEVIYGGMGQQVSLAAAQWTATVLKLVDYDNDGWLDILAAGDGVRGWRNLGQAGFRDVTRDLGLDQLKPGRMVSLSAADFDRDGDTDLLLGRESGGLQMLRNDGGNANHQLKLRLMGNRSNASGLGVRIEVKAAAWHALRTVTELPVEIGLGKYEKPDAVKFYWSDLSLPLSFDLQADPKMVWNVMELELPSGSCPYLYAWNGAKFRFVTDLLGAAPLGLRVSDDRFVEADPEEIVALGNDASFLPQGADYLLQVTEELREVLYLDDAKLIVVDHPPDTRVCTTSKMLAGRPFLPHELIALSRPHPLLRAEDHRGVEVTTALKHGDGQFVSPAQLRRPQLRGLAEPSSVTLDFGLLPVDRPLVLVLTGWIRFGGGMANVAASHDPNLPFPFPQLEAEVTPRGAGDPSGAAKGEWKAVAVPVGVPCGKTKTIVVDLTGKLPAGSRRLRLTTAFELHWDQAELWERTDSAQVRTAWIAPTRTDLHWRGFSDFEERPWFFPLTPDYDRVRQEPHWRITPAGWCTRYGPVDELLAKKDNALVLLNGGDELTLRFAADRLPPKSPGFVREFFFYSAGWDKDSDFHVERGTTVEPLPFHGMADQLYGRQARPVIDGDWWIDKYNTRWVGPMTLSRAKP